MYRPETLIEMVYSRPAIAGITGVVGLVVGLALHDDSPKEPLMGPGMLEMAAADARADFAEEQLKYAQQFMHLYCQRFYDKAYDKSSGTTVVVDYRAQVRYSLCLSAANAGGFWKVLRQKGPKHVKRK